MLKRLLKLFIILIIITAACYVLLATQVGLRGAYAVAKTILPGKIQVASIKGRLVGPIIIDKLNYNNHDLSLTVSRLRFDWQPMTLLTGKLTVTQLEATSVRLSLPKVSARSGSGSQSFSLEKLIGLSRRIVLGKILITQAKIISAGNPDIIIPRLQIASRLVDQQLNMQFFLSLTVVKSRLQIKGSLDNNWNIGWRLSSPTLNGLLPDLQGAINGHGAITGARNKPLLQAKLTATQLKFKNYKVRKLALESNLHIADQTASTVTLTADGLGLGTQKINKLNLTASGNVNSQNIKLHITHKKQQLNLQLVGELKNKLWQGKIKQFAIHLTTANVWNLVSAAPVLLSRQQANIDQLCLNDQANSNNKICLNAQWQAPNKIQANLQATSSSLTLLDEFLPDVQALKGQLSANLRLSGTLIKPKIVGKLTLKNASTFIPDIGVGVKDVTINASTDQRGKILFNASGTAGAGKINLTGWSEVFNENFPTEITATANNAHVYQSTQADIYASSPKFTLFVNRHRLDLTGKVVIAKARLTPRDFSDTVTLPESVVIIGKKKIYKTTPFAISARIQLLLGDNVSLNAKGLKAKLSGNLVIIEQPQQPTRANGELRITQGKYKAYGRELTISEGRLLFAGGPIDNPGLLIRAQKTQQIILQTGALKGQPQNLTVGVRVTGTLKQPTITLFSDPANLTRQEILSYLLFGQPIGQLSQNQGQALYQAVSALNLGGNGFGVLQKSIGLDQIGFDTEPVYDAKTKQYTQGTALVLGKYITPKLFINYSIGISEPINILRMRYHFNKNWSVQSETSGDSNGIDFLYTIEK